MIPTIANLTNVTEFYGAMMMAIDAPIGHPRLVGGFGMSGVGKSTAAAFVAARKKCGFVQVRSVWTAKDLVMAIARQVGLKDLKGTTTTILDRVIDKLAVTDQSLIIDECDHILRRESMIEVLRDFHDATTSAIMLIGEEAFPEKLEKASERTHNRVLTWAHAKPIDNKDALALRDVVCKEGAKVEDDLVKFFNAELRGNTRRVVVNLDQARELADQNGWEVIDREKWADTPINNGRFDRRDA